MEVAEAVAIGGDVVVVSEAVIEVASGAVEVAEAASSPATALRRKSLVRQSDFFAPVAARY